MADIVIRYFASAAEAAGVETESVAALANGQQLATVGELRSWLIDRYGGAMVRVLAAGSFLVDGVVSRDDSRSLGSQVDVMPPFAGG